MIKFLRPTATRLSAVALTLVLLGLLKLYLVQMRVRSSETHSKYATKSDLIQLNNTRVIKSIVLAQKLADQFTGEPRISRDTKTDTSQHDTGVHSSHFDYVANLDASNFSFDYVTNVSFSLMGYNYVIRPSCQSNQQVWNVACTCRGEGHSNNDTQGHAATGSGSTVVLTYVMSAPDDFETRLIARQTWLSGGGVRYRHLSLVLTAVFVLGLPSSQHNWTSEMQRKLDAESAAYGDIVQKDFVDNYANLSLKSVAALQWAREHCSRARYILKVDGDVFVHTPALMHYVSGILGYNHNRPTMHCYVKRYSPVMRWGRNEIAASLYPHPSYPLFCAGYAYLMHRDAADAIHARSLTAPGYFLNEDALVTGFLAGQGGVVFRSLNKFYVKRGRVYYRNKVRTEALKYSRTAFNFFFIHRLDSDLWHTLWRHILAVQ